MLWLMLAGCGDDAELLEERVAYLEWQAEQEIETRDTEIATLQADVAALQAAVADAEARIAELEPLADDVADLMDDAVGESLVYTHVCEGTESYSHTWEGVFDSEAPTHFTLWYRLSDAYADSSGQGWYSLWRLVDTPNMSTEGTMSIQCDWREDVKDFENSEYALVID